VRTIQEYEQRVAELQSQNKMMKFDIDRMHDEFHVIEKSNIDNVRVNEDRVRSNDQLLTDMEHAHSINCQKIMEEHNSRAKEIVRE